MTLNLKALILLIHICLVSTMAQAQGTVSRKSATALPTVTEIDGFMKRTFGYDPSITWQIVDIRESSIAGITELVASMNKGLPTHLYFSSSAQSAIVGEMIPFGKDPFAPARAKLQAANGPSRGSETPSSRIVVFTDLQCADCKAAQPIVERLAADFPRVLFTFQQFPLSAKHPWAMKGAEYADCAGQMNPGLFWRYVDSIFKNQEGITAANVDEQLKKLATSVGLDAERLAACSMLSGTDERIKKSQELGFALSVNEVPTVFINGRRVRAIATIPYENLKRLVQFEIDHAGR